MYGRDLFIIHNNFNTVEWKVADFYSENLSAPFIVVQIPLDGTMFAIDHFYL